MADGSIVRSTNERMRGLWSKNSGEQHDRLAEGQDEQHVGDGQAGSNEKEDREFSRNSDRGFASG